MTARLTEVLGVVVPVFDVAEYLPEFLASLEIQRGSLPREIVFIDDGSTDASAELLQQWIDAHHPSARLIRTANNGVSAARNTGLDAVTKEWVLFLDPDDVLSAGYFTALDAFFASHSDVDLLATNLLRLAEPDRLLRDSHPLRFRFAGGNRVAALEEDVFVMNAASVAFPVEAVRASGARFRTALHASEDALFVAEYLLSLGRKPRAGFVADAMYGYRKRAARTSAVDRYRSDPSTYTVRFSEGYAPLLDAAAQNGEVPNWLQSMILYEMQWLLPVQMDPQRYAANLDEAQRAATLAGLTACLRHVDERVLLQYDASALPFESRLLILALTSRELWPGTFATLPRDWRATTDIITYSTDAEATLAADAPSRCLATWAPDFFGQQVLFAHRVRADKRVRKLDGQDIVWPRPGESLAQTQDRHRRRLAGVHGTFIPAQEGEVYVRRTRLWATDARAIRRERRRRSLWSKDAWIGRLVRPARQVLFEHSGDDLEQSEALYAALARQARVRQVQPRHGPAIAGALRFGSLSHRLARARACMIVTDKPTGRPSLRARLRAIRTLMVDGTLSPVGILAVRRFSPDVVVTSSDTNVARLAAVGVPADDVVVVNDTALDAIVTALIAHTMIHEWVSTRKDAKLD